IQEQGGQRAGTLVQSLGRAAMLGRFGQSAQGKQYQAQWARMGLLESVELNGKLIKGVENVRRAADALEQKGSKVRNATVRDQSTLLSNPYQWATTTLIQGMKESGVKFGNKDELAQVLRKSGIMAGNQNLASV